MRKPLWIIPVLLLFAAIGAPYARADDIVEITISNLTFTGLSACGALNNTPCTESFSTTLDYDNTTSTVLTNSDLTTTSSGPLAQFSFTSSFNNGFDAQVFIWTDSSNDRLDFVWPFSNPIEPHDGNIGEIDLYGASLTCSEDFVGPTASPPDGLILTATYPSEITNLSFTVTSVSEPRIVSLMLLGIGFVLVMRKRIAQRLPQAS